MASRLTLETTVENRGQVVSVHRYSYKSEASAQQAFERSVDNARRQGFRRTPGRRYAGAVDTAHMAPIDGRRNARIVVVLRNRDKAHD